MQQDRLAPPDRQEKRAGLVRAALFLAFLALIAPILVADVPPLVDYPNHLARLWLEGGGADAPPLSSMYRIVWDGVTNIGIDLVASVLVPLCGYDAVGRLFVAAAALLPAIGGLALWRVLHGRFHWWQLSFALLAWNMGLVMGFLNFEIGLGIALLAAAADPALSRSGLAIFAPARIALTGLLLLTHVFALLFYVALLVGLAVGAAFRSLLQPRSLMRAARSLLMIGATVALPAALILFFAPRLPGAQTGANLPSVLSDFQLGFDQFRALPVLKIQSAFVGIRAYADWLDALTLAAIELPILFSLISGRLAGHAGMVAATAGLLVCYFVFPPWLAGTAWIDRRFALMASLAFAVALRPELAPRLARILAIFLLAVSLVRTGVVGSVWRARQADVAALSRVLDLVPPGAAILPLEHSARTSEVPIGRYTVLGEATFRHLPSLAAPWRRAFVPTLFAERGKQPIEVLAPWSEIAERNGGSLASVNALTQPEVYDRDLKGASYLKAWRERFDFALVLNADIPDVHGRFVTPDGLELVKDEGFAQLYRIQRRAP
jgi:hypothetical protein